MTRFLSDSLQAAEPAFRLNLRDLEASQGHPNHDIRLSTRLRQDTSRKLQELGLDPLDTTPEELYHVLQERMKADDARLTRKLRTEAATHVSAEADAVAGMVHVLKGLPDSKHCFALKNSSLRTMFKKQPPKKAMKRLGYRSVESFLKHEPAVFIMAVAWLVEGSAWRRDLIKQYKKLKPGDFENRRIEITRPTSKNWRDLAQSAVSQKKHNILSFKELGALVFLPLPDHAPPGAVTASLSLALHELNDIRASSTFLKLCQVRPDFGSLVRMVAEDEPRLDASLLDQPLSWQLIQRYYSSLADKLREEVFEPHIMPEDMAWHPIEETLSAIEPAFGFWKDSHHLGMLHGRQPVSMNLVDAAINYCNKLPFQQRVSHYFQQSLKNELMLHYLKPEIVERMVNSALQPELAKETALA